MEKPAQQSQFRGGPTAGAGTRPGSPFQIGRQPAPRAGVSSGLPRALLACGRDPRFSRFLDRPRYTGCTNPRRLLWGKTTPFQGG